MRLVCSEISVSKLSRGLKVRVGLIELSLAFALAPGNAWAQAPADPREVFDQLNQVSIDPTQIYALRNAQITRDRVKIYFNHGFVGSFTKVSGVVTGAVFVGEGEVLLIPPGSVEKRSLARSIKSPILEERFTSAYLRFTDQTARELLAVAEKPDPEDPEQPTGFLEEWNPVVARLNPDYSSRILQDLLGDRSLPYFHAQLQGVNLGIFEIVDDERSPEAVVVGAARRSHGKVYGDIWCSFPSRASEAHTSSLLEGSVRVGSYKIDTRINADGTLEGRAELELESRSSGDRVLALELSARLKVSEVKDAQGKTLVVFQNPSLESSEAAERGNDRLVVVLPAAHSTGERFRLEFAYQGNVITDVGNGVLYVGARGSWYPNRGLADRATYDLTFHYPDRLTLVATGSRLDETSAEGWKHSHWISDGPLPVAGFNLGAYESTVRRVGNSTIEVYAARGAEASLEKRHVAAQPAEGLVLEEMRRRKEPVGVIAQTVAPLAPAALLESVAQEAARSIEYFETLFGPFPYPRLAISQIPGGFGQGWPELVYLPTLSFLPESERFKMGLTRDLEDVSNQVLVPHEVAHQWWGNLLGWETYHDQWLSEGVASYAAALYLAEQKDGDREFRALLRGYKQDLLAKTKEGSTIESGGPIWLGRRLSNSLNPDGYSSIVYKKACWFLHMLRLALRDPKTGSDERFFKMLRDFVDAYKGRNASTEDFIRHAEKYMTQTPDRDHNQQLDWFFREWVYGTGVPSYKLTATSQSLGHDTFVVEGAIEQSEGPSDFEMLVPVVATLGKDKKVRLGLVPVTDAGGRFRFTTPARPSHIAIDEDEILAVVR